jgi:hypothetical protein
VARLDALIFANDSVYGLFTDLTAALKRCDDSAAIWGITDSWDIRFQAGTANKQHVGRGVPHSQSRSILAWRDLWDGACKSWMWTALALQDIKLRYRGSVLGPWWLTVTTLLMAVAMGLVYTQIFGVNEEIYLPYLTKGKGLTHEPFCYTYGCFGYKWTV